MPEEVSMALVPVQDLDQAVEEASETGDHGEEDYKIVSETAYEYEKTHCHTSREREIMLTFWSLSAVCNNRCWEQ
jgi:hypothetical protein